MITMNETMNETMMRQYHLAGVGHVVGMWWACGGQVWSSIINYRGKASVEWFQMVIYNMLWQKVQQGGINEHKCV